MARDHPDIATRAELDRWIEDRKTDPTVPELNHPKPSWVDDPDDSDRMRMRMRERRINHLENRLDQAANEMEQEFDQNS